MYILTVSFGVLMPLGGLLGGFAILKTQRFVGKLSFKVLGIQFYS